MLWIWKNVNSCPKMLPSTMTKRSFLEHIATDSRSTPANVSANDFTNVTTRILKFQNWKPDSWKILSVPCHAGFSQIRVKQDEQFGLAKMHLTPCMKWRDTCPFYKEHILSNEVTLAQEKVRGGIDRWITVMFYY